MNRVSSIKLYQFVLTLAFFFVFIFNSVEVHAQPVATNQLEQKLNDQELTDRQRATLVVDAIKVLTDQASTRSPAKRQAIWDRIATIAGPQFTRTNRSGELLIGSQRCLADITRVSLLRQEIAARLPGATSSQDVLDQLRQVRDRLSELIQAIDEAIPVRSNNDDDTEFSVEQLIALKANMQFQMAICNLERSQLYPMDDRANRIDALNQSQRQIADVVRSLQAGQPLWWQASVAELRCLRIAGKTDEALLKLKRLREEYAPPAIQTELIVEKLKLAIATNDAEKAESIAAIAFSKKQRSARLDLAILDATLFLATNRSNDTNNKWMNDSTQHARAIKTSHGDYWGRRANLKLLAATGNAAESPRGNDVASPTTTRKNIDLLRVIAANAVEQGRFHHAIEKYRQAIDVATEQNDTGARLQLSIAAAQCFEQLAQHTQAADLLFEAVESAKSLPSASAAHLRGCWNLAQAITGIDAAEPETVALQTRYQEQLAKHIGSWPNSPSSNSAKLWQGRGLLGQQQFKSAFSAFLSVQETSELFPEAIFLATASAKQILATADKQEATKFHAARLIEQLKNGQAKFASDSIDFWRFELLAAEVDLLHGSGRISKNFIDNIRQLGFSADDRLAKLAAILIAASSASASDEFKVELKQIANDPDQLESLHQFLQAMQHNENVDSAERKQLISANLRVAHRAAAATPKNARWQLRIANLQLAAGQDNDAIATLEALVKKFPRQADKRIKLATAITKVYGETEPDKAINQWRRIAAKLRPKSENWFQAKFNIAKLLHSSGKSTEALKLLKYIQATPPGWEKSKLKPEFELLLRKVSR